METNNNNNNNIQSISSQLPPPAQLRSPSYSSFTAELFGDNDSQPSTGIFSSIFPPPSTVLARDTNSSQFNRVMQEETPRSQVWTATRGTSAENVAKNMTIANSSIIRNMERRPPVFQERLEPSPLSSSLYYGGQEDMYVCSSSNTSSQAYPTYKKVDGKDDPSYLHSASRGNWWQGSLYY